MMPRFWILAPYVLHCSAFSSTKLAPEVPNAYVSQVSQLISDTFQQVNGNKADRYALARNFAAEQCKGTASHELVYGELSVPILADLLDAVGVEPQDSFLDIGSGDGALTLGAAMLYPDYFRVSRGLELVPGLLERSKIHSASLKEELLLPCEFFLGDVHDHQHPEISSILTDTTLAVCFATTWSAGNVDKSSTSLKGRALPKLSSSLTKMPKQSRILIVDGRLNPKDGYRWEGDMKIECPDTAPYSIASLYERIG